MTIIIIYVTKQTARVKNVQSMMFSIFVGKLNNRIVTFIYLLRTLASLLFP